MASSAYPFFRPPTMSCMKSRNEILWSITIRQFTMDLWCLWKWQIIGFPIFHRMSDEQSIYSPSLLKIQVWCRKGLWKKAELSLRNSTPEENLYVQLLHLLDKNVCTIFLYLSMIWNSNHHVVEFYNLSTYLLLLGFELAAPCGASRVLEIKNILLLFCAYKIKFRKCLTSLRYVDTDQMTG